MTDRNFKGANEELKNVLKNDKTNEVRSHL